MKLYYKPIFLITFLCTFLFSNTVFSAIQVFEFNDAKIEKRFNHLVYILRCPKCQNQNLADSSSDLSRDLEQIVYEKLLAGESDQQILDFMRQRYGEFILFEPELSQDNAFLWAGPGMFLLLTLFLFLFWYKKNRVSIVSKDKNIGVKND